MTGSKTEPMLASRKKQRRESFRLSDTPEKRPRFPLCLISEVVGDGPDHLDCVCAWGVSGEQDIEVGERTLLEAFIEIQQFARRGLCALDLSVPRVVACNQTARERKVRRDAEGKVLC